MAGGRPPLGRGSGSRAERRSGAVRAARRAVPVALELYRRWDRLPPHEKDRYLRLARQYGERGRTLFGRALEQRRRRRGR